MSKAIKRPVAAFFAVWIAAHAIYAFVMLDWSLFTEWEPFSRAMLLFVSLGLAFLSIPLELMEKAGE